MMENTEQNNAVANQSNGEPQAAGAAADDQDPSRGQTFISIIKSLVIRGLILYFIMSFFRRPQTQVNNTNSNVQSKLPSINIFDQGSVLDLYVYISDDILFNEFQNKEKLVWKEKGIVYGDWNGGENNDGTYSHDHVFQTPKVLLQNGSLYLHVFVTKHGESPDPARNKFADVTVSSSHKMINRFQRLKYKKTQNLLTGESAIAASDSESLDTKAETIVAHWHPNITINLVTDQTGWVPGSVPPPLDEFITFNIDGDTYKPPIYLNDYWNMQRDYHPVNETVKELSLSITYQPLSLFRWQLYIAQSMKNKWTSNVFGEGFANEEEADLDSLKEALLETSPYLLGITVAVSILHSVFELLAFKNDIQFWNNRQSLEGLSVRSVIIGVFQSLIVLLYVLDNDTNTIVKISCFIGLGIEVWKIHKVMDIEYNTENRFCKFLPRIQFKDRGSYVQSNTKEYDKLAFKYLSWALFPLLVGYMVYSLLYQEHKGWYSWLLSMLYGFLLTFGFIMMTPQLFINYKLKSVAHLPWRMMTYKFLNTFIDDIFAFVIKMPTMYRIGCFRDDIVFLVYLYQRWIYKTDPNRINEFGFSAEMEEAHKNQVAKTVNTSEKKKNE